MDITPIEGMDALEPTMKINKTADKTAYMNEYMKKKYHEDPIKTKMYKNSLNTRKKYKIDESTWAKYKHTLHHIVSIKEMIDQLPEGHFERFLLEYRNLKFELI